jgi:hypothetical protein
VAVDLGPIALALFGFNEAFTATTALVLTCSVLIFRLLALAFALGRARMGNQLRHRPNEPQVSRGRRARVEQTQLLSDQATHQWQCSSSKVQPDQ